MYYTYNYYINNRLLSARLWRNYPEGGRLFAPYGLRLIDTILPHQAIASDLRLRFWQLRHAIDWPTHGAWVATEGIRLRLLSAPSAVIRGCVSHPNALDMGASSGDDRYAPGSFERVETATQATTVSRRSALLSLVWRAAAGLIALAAMKYVRVAGSRVQEEMR